MTRARKIMWSWSADAKWRPAKSSENFMRLIHHGCDRLYMCLALVWSTILLVSSVLCMSSVWLYQIFLKISQKMMIFADFDDFWNFLWSSMDIKILLGSHIIDQGSIELILMKSREVRGKTRQKSQNGWIVHLARRWCAFRSPRGWEFFTSKFF